MIKIIMNYKASRWRMVRIVGSYHSVFCNIIVRFGKKILKKRCYYGIGTTFCQNLYLHGCFNYIGPIPPPPPPPTSLWNPYSEMINITRVTTKIKEGWHYILCLPSCEKKKQVSLPYLTHHMRCWWCHATQRISRMSDHASFSLLIELKLCEQEVRLRRGE